MRLYSDMTLESIILQRLGAGPVRTLDLEEVDQEDLALTLKFMVARRQICRKDGWISLYWHRHMIPSGVDPVLVACPLS